MSLINLDDSLKIGISEIDRQHKDICLYLLNIQDECKEEISIKEITVQIDCIIKIVSRHFSDEENIMSKYNYPYFSEHYQAHLSGINNLIEFKDKVANNEIDLVKLKLFATSWLNWFEEQISVLDTKLAEFLKTNPNFVQNLFKTSFFSNQK